MGRAVRAAPIAAAALTLILLAAGCATESRMVTEPPGMLVSINGQDFGPSPCAIRSTGTTFAEYTLVLRDPATGEPVHTQILAKNLRVWGIFWPPYGVFYNLFEFFPQYTARRAGRTWSVTPETAVTPDAPPPAEEEPAEPAPARSSEPH